MKKQSALFFIILCLLFAACSSDDDKDEPKLAKNQQYPVSLTITRSDSIVGYSGRSKVITQPRESTDKLGYKGVIIYYDFIMPGEISANLYAYELACPNCWNGNILTRVGHSLEYSCNICGLETGFTTGNGYFYDKNGKITNSMPLVAYEVTKIGDHLYNVTNPK